MMPIHRLNERPTQNAIVADITCDCDGRLDDFVVNGQRRPSLPLHTIDSTTPYHLGVFLVGAYQETLGDLHNLLGDTNVISVQIAENGHSLTHCRGDSLAEVLGYVAYDPDHLVDRVRELAGSAVLEGKLDSQQATNMVATYQQSLSGDTYFSS